MASAYIKFVENMRDVKKFIFWADNCAAQNKNWWLFTALREVNITDGPELITKYFEPGHTYMSSDSFHHLIKKGMKAMKRVEDFGDFQKIIDNNGVSLPLDASGIFWYTAGYVKC